MKSLKNVVKKKTMIVEFLSLLDLKQKSFEQQFIKKPLSWQIKPILILFNNIIWLILKEPNKER